MNMRVKMREEAAARTRAELIAYAMGYTEDALDSREAARHQWRLRNLASYYVQAYDAVDWGEDNAQDGVE